MVVSGVIASHIQNSLSSNDLLNNRQPEANLKDFPENFTYADLVVSALEGLGVKNAFGIPGGAVAELFNAISRSKVIQSTLAQHEGAAAYMALGASLASHCKNLGVCFATAGPGITNLITGIAAADAEGVPVLAITGNVSTRFKGKGAAQESYDSSLDAVRMLEPVTARSVGVSSPEEILPALLELYRVALHTRRPVHLNIPVNLAGQRIQSMNLPPVARAEGVQHDGERRLAESAIDAFLAGPRPVIFAGNGIKVSGLEPILFKAAVSADLPVIATTHGKGVFPEDHPLSAGCFGFAAPEMAMEFLKRYRPTAILFLGTRLGELASAGWNLILGEPEIRVQVDRNPDVLNRNYPLTHAIRSELEPFLELLRQMSAAKGARESSAHREIIADLQSAALFDGDRIPTLHGPIQPVDLVQSLDLWLPENAWVFSDIGNSMAWLIHHWMPREQQRFIVPLGLGSMGSGLGAALGAKAFRRDVPMVCVIGDCAALMHGTELFTAKMARVGVKTLILNDGGHGMVDHGDRIRGLKGGQVRFEKPVDFKLMGEALGIESYRASSLKEFLALPRERIFGTDDPVLIDLRIDPKPVPPILARTRVLGQSS